MSHMSLSDVEYKHYISPRNNIYGQGQIRMMYIGWPEKTTK